MDTLTPEQRADEIMRMAPKDLRFNLSAYDWLVVAIRDAIVAERERCEKHARAEWVRAWEGDAVGKGVEDYIENIVEAIHEGRPL